MSKSIQEMAAEYVQQVYGTYNAGTNGELDFLAGARALSRHDAVIGLRTALWKLGNDLCESGAYIVEDGFEEPAHCALYRTANEALKAFDALLAELEAAK